MAEKPKAPRKRPAPTIDLSAVEVNPAQPAPDSDFVDRAFAWLRAHTSMLTLAAAAIGGAMVAVVLAVLWIVGQIPDRYAATSVALPNNLDARLTKIEEQLAKFPANEAAINGRVAASDNAMKSLGIALAALNKRADDAASAAAQAQTKVDAAEKSAAQQVEGEKALQDRIAALENATKNAREEIAKNTGADLVARLVLSANALRDAVTRGAPYTAELAAAQSLGGDAAKSLQPLEEFAATGLPSDKALAAQLHALLPRMLKISGAAPDAGFFERLQANASNLVRISPVDAPRGNDVTSVLTRLESGIVGPNIGELVADVGLLPPNVRAPADDWLKRAQAKQAAVNTAQQFAAAAARALRSP